MKKFFFNSLIIAASIVVAASFTSCSKDNDGFLDEDGNEITGNNGNGGDAYTGDYEWFDPCLQWGCTRDEVVSFMNSKSGWVLGDEQMGIMAFVRNNPLTNTTYYISDGGLKNVSVYYFSTKNPETLKKKIEETYNCTLELIEDDDYSVIKGYEASNVPVNGKKCKISFYITKNMMGVTIYS